MPDNFARRQRPAVLVCGASGKLGGLLRRSWGDDAPRAIWQRRGDDAPGWQVWDMAGPYRGPEVDVILNLAGATSGAGVADHSRLALAALDAGRAMSAPVILVSSAAVYGPVTSLTAENARPNPVSAYGRAKAEMEVAAEGRAATILRIGNVAGSDALLGNLRPEAPVYLDRFADGSGPMRSYIGPMTLARVLSDLILRIAAGPVPPILNVAESGAVGMEALARAAGAQVIWRDAPAGAIPKVELDVSLLSSLVDLPTADPARMIAEWRESR